VGPARDRPAPAHDLVEVCRCTPVEAAVVRALLESAGIPALGRAHLVTALHPFSVGEQGRVAILVPAGAARRARALLARGRRRRPRGPAGPGV